MSRTHVNCSTLGALQPLPGEQVIDAGEHFVMPGLVDVPPLAVAVSFWMSHGFKAITGWWHPSFCVYHPPRRYRASQYIASEESISQNGPLA